MTHRFRCLTYNVRRYVGLDRRRAPERIADVIASANADLVVLQEAVEEDAISQIAEHLKMHALFAVSRHDHRGRFGNVLLCKVPMTKIRHRPLPTLVRAEARFAMWARLDWQGRNVDVIATHLGLSREERNLQTSTLCGDIWLNHAEFGRYGVLLGDFNAAPAESSFKRLDDVLPDAQRQLGLKRRLRTWPAPLPMVSIDHVFTSAKVLHASVVASRRARVASDHLPFFADLDLEEPR